MAEENTPEEPPELTIVPPYIIFIVFVIIALIFYFATTGTLDFAYRLIAGTIGLPFLIYTFFAIYSGKVIPPISSFWSVAVYFRDKNPIMYWLGIIMHGVIGIFLISKSFELL